MHHARQHRAARKMLQQFEDTLSLHGFQLFEQIEVPIEQSGKKTNTGTVTCDRTASSSTLLFFQKINGRNDPPFSVESGHLFLLECVCLIGLFYI